jgi:predicted nucleic acid-binding protein
LPSRLYLDTNVFIAAFETLGERSDAARELLGALDEDDTLGGVTSLLTLAELLVRPLRDADGELAELYRSVVTSTDRFDVIEVSREVLEEAAGLRAQFAYMKLPDAIHIATAKLAGCANVVSADGHLRLPPEKTLVDLDKASISTALRPTP